MENKSNIIFNFFIAVFLNFTPLNAQDNSQLIIPDFMVNDDTGSNHYSPAMVTDDNGNFVITWTDYRHGDLDIFAQLFLNDGTAVGNNFKVNDDDITAIQQCPSIAMNENRNFVITWEDYRNHHSDIYAQMYLHDGTVVGNNFKINDDKTNGWQYKPSIAMDVPGNFVITWIDERNFNADIYAQRFESDGSALGFNFKVNDDVEVAPQSSPVVSSDRDGSFVITWEDTRNRNDSNIYAQRYSNNGTKVGINFKVNDDPGSTSQITPAISVDGSGRFIIAWLDRRHDRWDIYAQYYLSNGTTAGSNFKVNDDEAVLDYQSSLSISANANGNFIITWMDHRNGDWDIFANRYLSNRTTFGKNFNVTTVNDKQQRKPCVKLWNDRVYNTWEDNQTCGSEYDIMANVLDWNIFVKFTSDFILYQNYPNPFNQNTIISYEFLSSGIVELVIYNILGEKVCTLVNAKQLSGLYQIPWDGKDTQDNIVGSGIYVYVLKDGDNSLAYRKMIMIK